MTLTAVMIVMFIAVALIVLAIGLVVRDLSTRRYDALDRRLGLDVAANESGEVLFAPTPPTGRIDRAFFRLIEESGTPLSAGMAMLIVVSLGLVGGAAALLFTDLPLAAAGGLAGGSAVPVIWWNIRRARRLIKMRKSLPEALETLADAVRSGRDLEQATQLAADDIAGPLSQEFSYCATQLRLGHSPVAVLERMVRRIPLPEFKVFATAVLVHRKVGGNLAELTERLAAAARDRQEFLGHLRSVTAGSKLSALGLVIGTVIAVCVLASLQPTYLQGFLTHQWGTTLLAIAAALQLFGIIWVYRILRVNF